MDRTNFVDVDNQAWWLLEADLESAVEERRQALGISFTWTDARWFTDSQKVEELFRFVEGTKPELLNELDTEQDNSKREQWINDVIAAKGANAPAAPEAPSASAAPAAEAAPAAPAAAPPEPKKPSLFGRKVAAAPPAASEAATGAETAAPSESEAATAGSIAASAAPDATGPRKSTLFARKAGEPNEAAPPAPASAAPASAAAEPAAPASAASRSAASASASPAAPASAAPAAEAEEAQLEEISEKVQNVMAGMSETEVAALASEMGLTVDQVREIVADPSFASAVAAQQSQS